MSPRVILPVLLLFAAQCLANETTKLTAFDQFEAQKSNIISDLEEDTVYREISRSDEKIVRDALDRMSTSLEGVVDLGDMTEDQRAALYNEQQLVNTVLTMAENDSRTVCRRRGRLGTNFKTTTCETVRERRERQASDRLAIEQLMRGSPITSN